MDKDMKYLKLLARQCYESQGKNAVNEQELLKSHVFSKDLAYWICERQLLGARYKEFLSYLGLDVTTSNVAEVGKGMYDTIVSDDNTTIITPYTYIKKNQDVLNYRLLPLDHEVYMTGVNNKYKNKLIPVPTNIDTFMTQNPYRSLELVNWDILHNCMDYDILVGIFGHIHDNDKLKKINMLRLLKQKLTSDIKVQYEIDRDAYYAAIYSDKNPLTKTKSFVKTK